MQFFVYGTLMKGFGNWKARLEGREGLVHRPAVLRGPYRLFHFDFGFPGLYRHTVPSSIFGELVTVSPSEQEATVRALDQLEDYFGPGDPRNGYERVTVEVETDQGPVAAQTYLCLLPLDTLKPTPVPSGDWRSHVKESSASSSLDPEGADEKWHAWVKSQSNKTTIEKKN
jgi:gamma-glutamylcyclotransferase (GGCT)/AIG2-like uncharacterized protein YtfP